MYKLLEKFIYLIMANEKISFRITFDKDVVDFMEDYKETHGATIQWFVERAVTDRIHTIKAELELFEIEVIANREINLEK